MGIARGWEKRVIRTYITYAKRTVRIFSVSPQSRFLLSASFQTYFFYCSRVLEYAKIRTVLQSSSFVWPKDVPKDYHIAVAIERFRTSEAWNFLPIAS